MKLSIVTTLYRSAASVDEFYCRAMKAAEAVTDDLELVIVNDGSPDNSIELALALQRTDPRVVVIDLARNFGHHKAMMTGLAHAMGDIVFLIDSDLEEQPEDLALFHQRFARGDCDVVYGVQDARRGGLLERMTGALFFTLVAALSDQPLPRNLVTARLMKREYVNALVRHRDREFLIAHLWQVSGFRQEAIVVKKLSLSSSTYSLRHRIELAVKHVTTTSTRLLYLVLYTGLLIFGLSVAVIIYYLGRYFTSGIGVDGFTSQIVSIWFLGGLITLILGILGIYIANIMAETKRRPYTIVRRIHRANSAAASAPDAINLQSPGHPNGRWRPTMTKDSESNFLTEVVAYYDSKLATHGPTPQGVDWNGTSSHDTRHRQFLRLLEGSQNASVTDLGCGFGDFWRFLCAQDHKGRFIGYDIVPNMIEKARALHGESDALQWKIGVEPSETTDFAIASGIFNVKGDVAAEVWTRYVHRTIDILARTGRRGFAFNALSMSSDPDRRRPDLYYADPIDMLAYCLARYGRSVALMQDYGLYEFTVVVRHTVAI